MQNGNVPKYLDKGLRSCGPSRVGEASVVFDPGHFAQTPSAQSYRALLEVK